MTEYTEKEKQNFVKNLKYLIERSGLSTRETAKRLGYEVPNLYKWRAGVTFPRADALDDIANFYKMTVKDLLGNRLPKQVVKLELPDGTTVSAQSDDFLSFGSDGALSGVDDVKIERYNANTAIIRVALKGRIL